MSAPRWPNVALVATLVMASGLAGSNDATAADGACDAFEVYTPKHGSSSTVVRLDLPTAHAVQLRTVTNELNGIGYAASQNLLYGISTNSHVVTIDPAGAVVDRGKVWTSATPPRAPSPGPPCSCGTGCGCCRWTSTRRAPRT
ncbi:hypothetical protein GCM10029964_026130 [Kibdelosporangium lantanae]